MSPRWVRRVVIVVCVGGVAGMIVGSILDNNGLAISFGIVTAVAAICLIMVTSVAPPEAWHSSGHDHRVRPAPIDEAIAADVERRVDELVTAGADELAVRQLVRRATELGTGPSAANREISA